MPPPLAFDFISDALDQRQACIATRLLGLYSFAMREGTNQRKTWNRDQWVAGFCALLVHLFMIVLLMRSASSGQGGYKGNIIGRGESLVVYPVMVNTKTMPRSEPQATQSPTENTTESKAEKSTVEQSPVSPTPDPSRPVQQAESTPSTVSSARRESRQSPVAPQTPDTTTSQAAAASSGGAGNDLLASYQAAMRAAIFKTWQGLSKNTYPTGCTIHLSQNPGGTVIATSAAVCGLSREDQLQLEAAALMAQPMPYAGYESVFSAEMDLTL